MHLWKALSADIRVQQGVGAAQASYMGHVVNAHEVTIQSVRLEAALWETRAAWMNIYLPKWLTRHLE